MANFYFTYGTSSQFPFRRGWTRVEAENLDQAIEAFRAIHPDRNPGLINCAFYYTEEQFKGSIMDTSTFESEHECLNAAEILVDPANRYESFYFTYGSAEHFPFEGGWTRVEARDIVEAMDAFKAVHPNNGGLLNCAGCYTTEMFRKTEMYQNWDNRGSAEHEVIQARLVLDGAGEALQHRLD